MFSRESQIWFFLNFSKVISQSVLRISQTLNKSTIIQVASLLEMILCLLSFLVQGSLEYNTFWESWCRRDDSVITLDWTAFILDSIKQEFHLGVRGLFRNYPTCLHFSGVIYHHPAGILLSSPFLIGGHDLIVVFFSWLSLGTQFTEWPLEHIK